MNDNQKDHLLLANDGSIGVLINGNLHEFRMTPAELRQLAGEMLAVATVIETSEGPLGGPAAGNA